MKDVLTASLAFWSFFIPKARATTTLTPMDKPMQKLMMRPKTGTLLPTAATARSETKRPKTATSAAL